MGFRPAVLSRLLLAAAACLLGVGTATVTFAATRTPSGGAAELVVPDVRHQAFVFAKGALEEAGFAWKVRGPVKGYAANTVVAQTPAPGARVRDTGAPTITLTLRRNGGYAEQGTPENAAPYRGTAVRSVQPVAAARVAPARVVKQVAKAKPKPAASKPKPKAARRPAKRAPAFHVAGAPREPLDEITLDARARKLDAWLAKHPDVSAANVRHWSYQHAWIVTGARFGWSHGDVALRLLIAVDRKIEARWGVGTASRTVAEQALAEVRTKTR